MSWKETLFKAGLLLMLAGVGWVAVIRDLVIVGIAAGVGIGWELQKLSPVHERGSKRLSRGEG